MATTFFAKNTTMQEMEYAFESTYRVLVNYHLWEYICRSQR